MTTGQALILLVDDDPDLLSGLSTTLIKAGFQVVTARDGEEALSVFKNHHPDLVLLDLMLPVKDGLDVCKEIRQISEVPILMLTARDDTLDKILGLELGADDYVTEPFNSRELLARIKAILRRTKRQYPGTNLVLDQGRIQINLAAQEVSLDGKPIKFTPTEFALLAYFAQNPGRVFTRQVLLEQVWGYDFPGDLRTVDVHIRRLRQKIEQDPANPRLILTRFGVGYVFHNG